MTDQMKHSKASKDELADVLHMPSRADRIESLEVHLRAASSLARALWLRAIADETASVFTDPRDRAAFDELATSVADRASAALFAFLKERET